VQFTLLGTIHPLWQASRGEGSPLICYEALRKYQRGVYIVPLHRARELSGQSCSTMKKTPSFVWNMLSSWQTYSLGLICKHMHVPFTEMPDRSLTIGIFEGAWWELVELTAGEVYTYPILLDSLYLICHYFVWQQAGVDNGKKTISRGDRSLLCYGMRGSSLVLQFVAEGVKGSEKRQNLCYLTDYWPFTYMAIFRLLVGNLQSHDGSCSNNKFLLFF